MEKKGQDTTRPKNFQVFMFRQGRYRRWFIDLGVGATKFPSSIRRSAPALSPHGSLLEQSRKSWQAHPQARTCFQALQTCRHVSSCILQKVTCRSRNGIDARQTFYVVKMHSYCMPSAVARVNPWPRRLHCYRVPALPSWQNHLPAPLPEMAPTHHYHVLPSVAAR